LARRAASHSYKTRRHRRADHLHSNSQGVRKMPVLVTAQVENQTEQLYDGMLSALAAPLKQAEGFVMHSAHRAPSGEWLVQEIWQTKAQADQFFARFVAPNLPPGVRPKRKVVELHSLVTVGA
jgi:hypothetical protein